MAWNSPGEFYSAVYDRAIALGANDVQARLAAAQAAQETGFGEHFVGNNLFGIKASDEYAGPTVNASTNEEYNGQNVRENANFRAYDDPLASVGGYLATIQQNFPDAWNAPTFSEAVQGLNTGVFGSYATDSQYGNRVAAIDNALGGSAFAANPSNIPTPYGPNDIAPDYAVADDVLPMAMPNFVVADPELAYASNPSNVPAPEARPQQPGLGLLSAFQATPTEPSPFDAVMGDDPGWGLNRSVAPVPYETFNQWDAVAGAPPVSTPLGNVPSPGLLGAAPITQADVDRALFNVTGDGQMDPSFTAGLMGPSNPVVPTSVESVSYTQGQAPTTEFASAPAEKTSRIGYQTLDDTARMSPLSGLLNPATNTASFMDQPSLLSSPSALMANMPAYQSFDPAPGVFSAYDTSRMMKAVEDQAAQDLANASSTPMFNQTSINNIPGLANEKNPYGLDPMVALNAQPADIGAQLDGTSLTPGLLSAPVSAPVSSLLSPNQLSTSTGLLTGGTANDIIGSQPVQQQGFVSGFPDDVVNSRMTPAAPSLETIAVPDQPSVASVEGPATTPAIDQQEQQQAITAPSATNSGTQTPSRSTLGGMLSKAINPGTIGGGLLGGLALGPAGGLVGGLLGNAAYNGNLGGLLGSSPMSINNIGGGLANTSSIWGGGTPAGTQATANDGQTVTSMGNGYTAITGRSGVVTVFDNNGKAMSYHGSALGGDPETESSNSGGGFFGGLFG